MRRSLTVLVFAFVLAGVAGASLFAQYGAIKGEWRHYGGDTGTTKYSPLDQINRENVKDLRIAWRWKGENFGPRPDFNNEVTPIMANGVLYATAGTRKDVVAIDPATGETLWMYRFDEGSRGARAPVRPASGRGVSYWTDGKEERILHITLGYRLVALDAKTGRPVPSFGKDGIVDLYDDFDQARPQDGQITSTSPPLVVRNVVVVGSAMGPTSSKFFLKGYVRGYDVHTGKRVWIFHSVPQAGEFGNDTWKRDSWAYTGNVGVWATMSADEELGYLYLPFETATSDWYGGHRPGDNLFADTLVCLNAQTGERVWHYQLVHHGIWDWDIPTAPNLVDLTVNGKRIKAIAQTTKHTFTFVFDRVTGQPVFPIEERPVPQGDVPGEWYSPTQPWPSKPAPFDRVGITTDDLIDYTPELRAEAVKIVSQYKVGPMFSPPIVAGTGGYKAMMQLPAISGGGNWQGAAVDAETGVLYVASVTNPSILSLSKDPKRAALDYVGTLGAEAARRDREGPRIVGDGLGPQGLPLMKPPYGRITAIDLNTGEHLWMMPNGDTPESIKNHPALKGVTLPRTGTPDRSGIMVTKTLVFAGEGSGTFGTTGALNGGGPMFYAYDKRTGEIVSRFTLPSNQSGIPMTYMVNGKQYIVVPTSAKNGPAEFVALSLP